MLCILRRGLPYRCQRCVFESDRAERVHHLRELGSRRARQQLRPSACAPTAASGRVQPGSARARARAAHGRRAGPAQHAELAGNDFASSGVHACPSARDEQREPRQSPAHAAAGNGDHTAGRKRAASDRDHAPGSDDAPRYHDAPGHQHAAREGLDAQERPPRDQTDAHLARGQIAYISSVPARRRAVSSDSSAARRPSRARPRGPDEGASE